MLSTRTNTIGTIRLRDGDKSARIIGLVYQDGSERFAGKLAQLKPAADRKLLVVSQPWVARDVHVKIFPTKYGHLVAETDGDSILVNNLDRLPIYPMPVAWRQNPEQSL